MDETLSTDRCPVPWCDLAKVHTVHERCLLTELVGGGWTVQLVEHGRGDVPTDLTMVLVPERVADADLHVPLPSPSALRVGLHLLRWAQSTAVAG